MHTANIRRSFIRLAGIVAIMTGLVMSSGVAAATQVGIGLTECNLDSCAVVTIDDLKAARAELELTVLRPKSFPTDRHSPHFIP